MALLIYTPKINSRIQYAFEHIFENVLGVEITFCNDVKVFKNFNDAKLAYTNVTIDNAICFKKHAFIDEQNISLQALAFAEWNELQIPFSISNSVFSFDVFAATFYFLTRYEEYVLPNRDAHLRFEGKYSLAYKNGFINRPIIDEWAYAIAKTIKAKYNNFEIKDRKFKLIPTLDIDRPYHYRTDSLLKKTAKIILVGFKKDPFDVYQMVKNWDKSFGVQTLYFFLLGNKHENDVAPNMQNKLFKNLLKQIAKQHEVGIHPSYFSFLNSSEVVKEKAILENMITKPIHKSRQHYLLLSLPKTYEALINAGISKDYTLAFADVAGFRASTCTAFYWYNLSTEKTTHLKLYPTAVMDQTLKRYMALSIDEANHLLEELIANVKAVNGTFISLWHNESINNFKSWKGWQAVYLKMLAKAKQV